MKLIVHLFVMKTLHKVAQGVKMLGDSCTVNVEDLFLRVKHVS